MCAGEFGYKYSKQELSNGLVVYKRLGERNWGPDDIVMIYTNLGSIPIMATVKPNTTYTTSGPNTSFNQITSISAISTRYIVYRLYVDQSVPRCFNLGPFTTLSEANLAVEQVSADEFRDRYKKEEFSNGLVSYKRLGKGNWGPGPEDTVGFYTNSDSEYLGPEDGNLPE